VSRLIPSESERRRGFLIEAAKAFGAVSSVLGHFGCEPKKSGPLDFSGFVEAMQAVCQNHRRDCTGMEDLLITISVFDSYHEAVREIKQLDDERCKRGLVSAQRLRWWLQQTFPDAGSHPEKN
jgi:hypothetical protein